jgi:hypothetical protein
MAQVENVEKVIATLRAKAAAAIKDNNVSVVVGYTAAYALYVHEMMEPKHLGEPRASGIGTYWGPNGSPKFLEAPFREMNNSGELGKIIKGALQQKRTMAQALLLAGLALQAASMKRVPVEYGNLRASAFTRLDVGKK